MAEEPDRLRAAIEQDRYELVRDVDALADHTLPNRVASRKWNSVKASVRRAGQTVMGTSSTGEAAGGTRGVAGKMQDKAGSVAHDVADKAGTVADKAGTATHEAAETVRQAPTKIRHQTQGSPIAVGLIAAGAGALVAALLPPTAMEQRLAGRVREHTGDLADAVREPAEHLKEAATESVKDATHEVRDTAEAAAHDLKSQAKESAQSTMDSSRSGPAQP
ncbi:MAG: DUF3618 domain-containing protein [Catenulispora sp.]|nr:DUF3618 domain-containing protein [Catenulispora sp.]